MSSCKKGVKIRSDGTKDKLIYDCCNTSFIDKILFKNIQIYMELMQLKSDALKCPWILW